jgi:hypothetical protein
MGTREKWMAAAAAFSFAVAGAGIFQVPAALAARRCTIELKLKNIGRETLAVFLNQKFSHTSYVKTGGGSWKKLGKIRDTSQIDRAGGYNGQRGEIRKFYPGTTATIRLIPRSSCTKRRKYRIALRCSRSTSLTRVETTRGVAGNTEIHIGCPG